MEKTVIAEGKTSNEAINNGLKKLGCKLEDVEVKVLENEDKKVFFSILDPRVVKVQLTMKENNSSRNKEFEYSATTEDVNNATKDLKAFLDQYCNSYNNIEYKIEENEKILFISIDGEEASKMIGYRGETISAMQTILSVIGNKNTENRVRIILDVCGYKEKREETLQQLAIKLEKTVKRTGKRIVLEPMNGYERKIIHTALQNSEYVTTHSTGEEPRRKVVVERK